MSDLPGKRRYLVNPCRNLCQVCNHSQFLELVARVEGTSSLTKTSLLIYQNKHLAVSLT